MPNSQHVSVVEFLANCCIFLGAALALQGQGLSLGLSLWEHGWSGSDLLIASGMAFHISFALAKICKPSIKFTFRRASR